MLLSLTNTLSRKVPFGYFFLLLDILSHVWNEPHDFGWLCSALLHVYHLRHRTDHGAPDPRGIHYCPRNPLHGHGRTLPAPVETPWRARKTQRLD